MITLTREKGNRMWGGGSGSGSVRGSGGSVNLSGYATESWVDDNYLSKDFWGNIFVIHTKITTVVTDDQGEPVGEPVITTGTLNPNELPGSVSETDESTGYTTTVTTTIDSIEAKKGLWTNQYISALGKNSSSGGGGGATALANLMDVEFSGTPSDGQVLKYNGTTHKWYNGTDQGVTSLAWNQITGKPATATRWPAFSEVTGQATASQLPNIENLTNFSTKVYDASATRSANTVLAAPNGSNGAATFRALVAADIPNLSAGKITSGTFDVPRIPNLSAGKITSGTFDVARIPNLDASKITSGIFDVSRIPDLSDTYATTGRVSTIEGYFTNGVANEAARLSSTNKTAWGQTYWSSDGKPTNISNAPLSGVTNIGMDGSINGCRSIELNTGSGHSTSDGGFFDFHYNGLSGNTPDYTLRLIEQSEGVLSVLARTRSGNTGRLAGIEIGSDQTTASYIQIGAIRIVYDDSNNALKVTKIVDGTEVAANLYATGGVSALGYGSSGGGGGATTLYNLTDVNIPATMTQSNNGQVLTYNAAQGKWINTTLIIPSGTVTSIGTGTGLSGGTITSSGTISISSTYLTYISHGESAYNSLQNYLLKSGGSMTGELLMKGVDVALGTTGSSSDITGKLVWKYGDGTYKAQMWMPESPNSTTGAPYGPHFRVYQKGNSGDNWLVNSRLALLTDKVAAATTSDSADRLSVVSKTAWGQTFWSSNGVPQSISGSLSDVVGITMTGSINGAKSIELNNQPGAASGNGGFIDFHYGGSSSDYTSRIIEDASGRLYLNASNGVRIGGAVLLWNSSNNSLYLQKTDGTAANLYATGGISALGFSNGENSDVSVSALTANTDISTPRLTLTNPVNNVYIYSDGYDVRVQIGSQSYKLQKIT